jgi:STE24 endopeptidase
VKVREILLWRTSGSMINAAVMGLLGRLRYVLITDALLETMPLDQVRAVMAHEVGHVRKHHMSWMVITLIGVLVLTAAMIELPLMALDGMGLLPMRAVGEWGIALMLIVQLAAVLLIFGWISRRFERQADTFAVEHLSATMDQMSNNSSNPLTQDEVNHNPHDRPAASVANIPPDQIHPEAVATMCSALQTVAEMNAVEPNRPSWRHGSIAWRQTYLHSIIGEPIGTLPIDSTIRRIKIAAGIVVAGGIIGWIVMTMIGA